MKINYGIPQPFSGYFNRNTNNIAQGIQQPWWSTTPMNYSQTLMNNVGSRFDVTNPVTVGNTGIGSGINYGLADTRANTIIGADLSAFRTPTETTNWFGKTTQGINYDHLGAFNSLNQNPEFNNYFRTLSPQQQSWIQNNAATLNTQNLETINAQMNSALTTQANNAWTNYDILGGVQAGIGAIVGLSNLWSGYKQTKLLKESLEEQKALNRANFMNQAKQLNNAYRDQASGRGTTVMSDSARRSIGDDARKRFVRESY